MSWTYSSVLYRPTAVVCSQLITQGQVSGAAAIVAAVSLCTSLSILQRTAMIRALLATAFLSVTSLHCVKTNRRKMMPSSPLSSTMYLVFGDIRSSTYSQGITPNIGGERCAALLYMVGPPTIFCLWKG